MEEGGGLGWCWDDSSTLHWLCTWFLLLWHQLHLRSSGIRSQRVGIPALRIYHIINCLSCQGSSDGKESACKAEDLGLIPGLGRSLGGGNGNQLQYSCLENPMDRGAWRATIHGSQRVGHKWATKHTRKLLTYFLNRCSYQFPKGNKVEFHWLPKVYPVT